MKAWEIAGKDKSRVQTLLSRVFFIVQIINSKAIYAYFWHIMQQFYDFEDFI